MVDTALLAEAELFQGFPPEALRAVAELAERRQHRRNDELFGQDDDAHELFVVEKGRIAISNRSPDGRESVVALMERADLFGEMGLFDRRGRSAGARALEPSTVVAIPYDPLRRVLEDDPRLLWGIVELLARRLRSTDEALADAVFLDVTGRTAKRLLELAAGEDEFQLPVTQEELAGMVGASRERVNKAIASFIRLGWIDQRDRRYRITDREQLTRRAR